MIRFIWTSYGILLIVALVCFYAYRITFLLCNPDIKSAVRILRKILEDIPLCLSIFLYAYQIPIGSFIIWQGYCILYGIIRIYRIFFAPQKELRAQIQKEFAADWPDALSAIIGYVLIYLPGYTALVLYAFGGKR